jgi:HK97 family phage prohead protease
MNERLEVKATLAVDDTGTITGNAWPFGEADRVGDMIVKGAVNVVGSDLPILYQHDPADLVGTWHEVKQTDEGLIVKGQLHVDRPRVRSVLAMVKSGLVSGLSIGFKARSWTGEAGRNRIIAALDLFEVSIVRNPNHPKARILNPNFPPKRSPWRNPSTAPRQRRSSPAPRRKSKEAKFYESPPLYRAQGRRSRRPGYAHHESP